MAALIVALLRDCCTVSWISCRIVNICAEIFTRSSCVAVDVLALWGCWFTAVDVLLSKPAFSKPSRRQTVLYAEGTKVRERENSQHGLIDEWRRTSAGRPALSSWRHDHNDLYRREKRDSAFPYVTRSKIEISRERNKI